MERARASDVPVVGTDLGEAGRWLARWRVEKWQREEDFLAGLPPAEVVDVEGNILVNAGINLMLTLLTGGAGTPYNSANAYLGVGDSTTAESASQTDLQAATNKLRKGMDTGYPSVSGTQVTFRSTFGSTEANFAWNEVGVFNASTGGTMLNRKVVSLGTKSSGATWTLTLTITIS